MKPYQFGYFADMHFPIGRDIPKLKDTQSPINTCKNCTKEIPALEKYCRDCYGIADASRGENIPENWR